MMLLHLQRGLKSRAVPSLSSSHKARPGLEEEQAVPPLHTTTTKASEEIFAFFSCSQRRLTATCGQRLASARRAILPKLRARRRPVTAMALLIEGPPLLKELQGHPSANISGLLCLISRSLSSNQNTGSCSLASSGLVSWGLGYAKAGKKLWFTVSFGAWSLCDATKMIRELEHVFLRGKGERPGSVQPEEDWEGIL